MALRKGDTKAYVPPTEADLRNAPWNPQPANPRPSTSIFRVCDAGLHVTSKGGASCLGCRLGSPQAPDALLESLHQEWLATREGRTSSL